MINSFHQDGADWRNVLEYRGIPFNFEETKHVQQGGLYSPGWDRFVILDSSFNRNRTIILYFRDRFINFSTFGDFGSLMDPSIWKARGWRYCESTKSYGKNNTLIDPQIPSIPTADRILSNWQIRHPGFLQRKHVKLIFQGGFPQEPQGSDAKVIRTCTIPRV